MDKKKNLHQELLYAYATAVEERSNSKKASTPSNLELQLKAIIDDHILRDNNLVRLLDVFSTVTYNTAAQRHDVATEFNCQRSPILENVYGEMAQTVAAHLKSNFEHVNPEVKVELLDRMQTAIAKATALSERFMEESLQDPDDRCLSAADINYMGFRNQRFAYEDLQKSLTKSHEQNLGK